MNNELNYRIRELEAALESAQLLSQEKSDFLATISHEIRTPMNAILGMVGLLAETDLTVEQQDFVATIRTASQGLLTLIDELLDFSRLESGEIELETLNFDLEACLEEVVELLSTTAYAKQLELALLIEREVPTQLQGDGNRLRQILINLIANAIKFTESGEVIIRAELRSQTSTSTTILFSVTDTGIGIPASARDKIFQPFAQVDASIKRQYGGTGLGLAICKQLVNLMGGEIGVESIEYEGSRFWFTLTFARQPIPSVQVLKPWHNLHSPLEGVKLLIVERNPSSREILRYYAQNWGVQVDDAANATTALQTLRAQALQETPYDIVLLDLQTLGSEGDTLGLKIKSDPLLSHTRLILMSSWNQRLLSKQLSALGLSESLIRGLSRHRTESRGLAHLPKPVRISRLWGCLLAAVDPRHTTSVPIGLRSEKESLVPEALPSLSALKILVVDDVLVNQKLILQQLRSLGCSADTASDGQEALQLHLQHPYDLILMDCHLPLLNGYETTQAIRKREGSDRHTIIVALTANQFEQDRKQSLQAGMDDFLTKPLLKEVLLERLTYWSQVIASQRRLTLPEVQPAPMSLHPQEVLEFLRLDWEQLLQVAEGDEGFALELLHLYVSDQKLDLAPAKQWVERKDFLKLREIAHKLKGSSANLGIQRIQSLAEQLQQQALNHQQTGMGSLLVEIEKCLNQVEQFILLKQRPLNPSQQVSSS